MVDTSKLAHKEIDQAVVFIQAAEKAAESCLATSIPFMCPICGEEARVTVVSNQHIHAVCKKCNMEVRQ